MAWQPGASSLGGNLRLNTERAWQQNMFSEKGQLSRQVRKEMEGGRNNIHSLETRAVFVAHPQLS